MTLISQIRLTISIDLTKNKITSTKKIKIGKKILSVRATPSSFTLLPCSANLLITGSLKYLRTKSAKTQNNIPPKIKLKTTAITAHTFSISPFCFSIFKYKPITPDTAVKKVAVLNLIPFSFIYFLLYISQKCTLSSYPFPYSNNYKSYQNNNGN